MPDRRGDELAAAILRPLDPRRRARLVAAMEEVQRLLTASMIEVAPVDPAHPLARRCLREYFAELSRRFEGGFDPALSVRIGEDDLRSPNGVFLLARLRTEPVGCGALRLHDGHAELKRIWVAGTARGMGLGRRLLDELERHAASRGARLVRLDTNRALTEAIAMYRAAGYVEIDRFNDDRYSDHWFEKRLV